MKSVLILDANKRSALAVTRSLGKHGVVVFTADESVSSLSGSSRYSRQYFQYPSARNEEDKFIAAVKEFCLKHQIGILIPVTELTSGSLLAQRHLFENTILPFADLETVSKLSDKCKLVGLAKDLGIPVPVSVELNAGSIPDQEFLNPEQPRVLKPGLSWLKTDSGWISTSVQVSDSHNESIRLIEKDPAFQNHNYLLQEYVSGHGEGIFAIYNNGTAVAFFAHKRLREKPLDGGVSVLSESVDIDPTLLKYAQEILDHVSWHGIAMVEFRVEDESIYLMEVNTRFWGSLQLAIDSGVDFPWLLYQIACGENVEMINEYKKGRRLRWLIGDIKWLMLVFNEKKWSFAQKLEAVIAFFTPHPFITRFEVNRWADLNPFYWEIRRNISKIINRRSS